MFLFINFEQYNSTEYEDGMRSSEKCYWDFSRQEKGNMAKVMIFWG